MEKIKQQIEDVLVKMGGTDIEFINSQDDAISVVFNCKEITNFIADIPGWTYSGIYLDTSNNHQYKIDFKKSS